MLTITPSEAVSFVRTNLDELDPNGSVMYDPNNTYGDNASLDDTIKRTLPEAINAVHRVADPSLLDGVDGKASASSLSFDNGVLSFSLPVAFLRIAAFKAVDSTKVLADWTDEYSPAGRMQLDPYARGVYDDPVLVRVQGEKAFRYYTITEATATAYANNKIGAVSRLEYVPELTYAAATQSYNVATRLKEAALQYLTGMVLSIYGEAEKAGYFFERAKVI